MLKKGREKSLDSEKIEAWGPFLEGPEKFPHSESHSKISNLIIIIIIIIIIAGSVSFTYSKCEQKFPLYKKFQTYTTLCF